MNLVIRPFAKSASLAVFSSLGAAFLTLACGGGSAQKTGAYLGTAASTLKFARDCSPSTCPGTPNGNADGTATCAKTAGDDCTWDAAQTNSSEIHSTRVCDPGECKGTPAAITCPPGYFPTDPACLSEDGAACQSASVCVVHGTGEACAEGACGDQRPAIAIMCGDGGFGELACQKSTIGTCGWWPGC